MNYTARYLLVAAAFATFINPALSARVTSLAEYEAQKTALTRSLSSMGLAQKPQPPKAEDVQNTLPKSLQNISEDQRKELMWLVDEINKVYPGQGAQALNASLMRNPHAARSLLLLLQTKKQELPAILKSPQGAQTLIFAPEKLLTKGTKKPFRIIPSMLSMLKKIKTFMSPALWGDLVSRFVGSVISRGWHYIWKGARSILVETVGAEKIYETNTDGSIKTDKNGNRLPRMVITYEVDGMGQPVKKETPNKWYQYTNDEDSLMAAIFQSGLDRTTKSFLESADRLFFQPLASSVLRIAPWQMSYTNYRVSLYESNPYHKDQQLLSPHQLALFINTTKNKGRLFASGLPFNLRGILSTKDQSARAIMLENALALHVWSEYEKVWTKAKNGNQYYAGISYDPEKKYSNEAKQNTPQTRIKSPEEIAVEKQESKQSPFSKFTKNLAEEAKKVGADALRAKIDDGPIAPYAMYADLALRPVEAMLRTTGDESQSTENISAFIAKNNILDHISSINQIASLIRQNRSYGSYKKTWHFSKDDQGVISLTKKKSGNVFITLEAEVAAELLLIQERLFEKYIPLMPHNTLTNEPHAVFLKNLILPRLILGIAPEWVKGKLDINDEAQVAKFIKTIEKNFSTLYQGLEAVSRFWTMVETFKGKETYAGHYVEITDATVSFLMQVNSLLGTLEEGPSMKTGKYLENALGDFTNKHKYLHAIKWRLYQARTRESSESYYSDWLLSPAAKLFHASKTKIFSPSQRQALTNAFAKAGDHTIGRAYLPMTEDAVVNYLKDENSDISFKEGETKGDLNQLRKNILSTQGVSHSFSSYHMDQNTDDAESIVHAPLSIENLINLIDAAYQRHLLPPDKKTEARYFSKHEIEEAIGKDKEKVANRAYELLMFTLGVLAQNKKESAKGYMSGQHAGAINDLKFGAKELKDFKASMELSVYKKIRGLSEFVAKIYLNYALREILGALDEHYLATGEKPQTLPKKLIVKIAVRESCAHVVGIGAEKLFGKFTKMLMSWAEQFEGTGLVAPEMITGKMQSSIAQIVGGHHGKSSIYHAARSLIHDVFTYGVSNAVSTENVMGIVQESGAMNALPMGEALAMMSGGASNPMQRHIDMIKESGKAPMPITAARMRKMGIDPDKILAQARAQRANNNYDKYDDIDDPSQNGNDIGVTSKMAQLINKAIAAVGADDEDAIKEYIFNNMSDLSEEEQESFRGMFQE